LKQDKSDEINSNLVILFYIICIIGTIFTVVITFLFFQEVGMDDLIEKAVKAKQEANEEQIRLSNALNNNIVQDKNLPKY